MAQDLRFYSWYLDRVAQVRDETIYHYGRALLGTENVAMLCGLNTHWTCVTRFYPSSQGIMETWPYSCQDCKNALLMERMAGNL